MTRDRFRTVTANPKAILGGLIALGTLLRMAALERQSLWFDEAVSYLVARLPIASIMGNAIQDPHPPFYYALLHFWLRWLPQEVIYGRLLSALCGVMLIPAVYTLAKEIYRYPRIALFAALLAAVSPFQLLYSYEMRMYTWLMFLVTLQTLAYLRARRSGRKASWSIFLLLTLCALYTHLFSGLALVGMTIHAFRHRRDQKSFRWTIFASLLAALLFLPWMSILASESQIGAGSLRPLVQDRAIEFNILKPVTSLTFLLFGLSNVPWYVAIAFFLTLSFVAIVTMEAYKSRRSPTGQDLLLPVVMATTIIGVPVAVYFVRPFFLPERTMAAASPFLMMLLAWGTTRIGSPLPYLAGGTAIAMAIGSILYLTGEPVKPPYREAIRYVEQYRSDSDVVVHTSDASYLPSLAYVNFPEHILLAGDPEPRKPDAVIKALGGEIRSLEQLVGKRDRLWLIVALEHSHEWQRSQASLVKGAYAEVDAVSFDGISVTLYVTETG